jgi:hypothetical protein
MRIFLAIGLTFISIYLANANSAGGEKFHTFKLADALNRFWAYVE